MSQSSAGLSPINNRQDMLEGENMELNQKLVTLRCRFTFGLEALPRDATCSSYD